MKKRILVVDDEEKLRRVIELHLISAGFDVDKARSAEEALKLVDRADMVITDLRLPSMDGLELLSLIRRQNTQAPVVVMTAFGTIENAVEAMKSGATARCNNSVFAYFKREEGCERSIFTSGTDFPRSSVS